MLVSTDPPVALAGSVLVALSRMISGLYVLWGWRCRSTRQAGVARKSR
ncbi:hypothetical protein ACTMU2_09185 [Cupriavidus basilensis]